MRGLLRLPRREHGEDAVEVVGEVVAEDAAKAEMDHATVKQKVLDRLNVVGQYPKQVNEVLSTLTANMYQGFANKTGETAEQLYEKHTLNVEGGKMTEEKTAELIDMRKRSKVLESLIECIG